MATTAQTRPAQASSQNGAYAAVRAHAERVAPAQDIASVASQSRRPREYVAAKAPTPASQPRNRLDPTHVHFSRPWLVSGALLAAGGLLGLHRYGLKAALGGGALGLAALAHMVFGEPARPVLERVTLKVATLPAALDGLRIGQISDSHLGLLHTTKNMAWAVEQMRREQPDLLVLTGDQVMHHRAIPELARLLRGLQAPLGTYAIVGNHDHWEGVADVRAALSMCGIPLLLNEHRRLRWRDADLWLIGVDDVWEGEMDFGAALSGVPADGFKLLLAHAPDVAEEAAVLGIDVQLSGHVHGGHMRAPLLGPFVRPRYGVRYLDGVYQVGRMTMYVSRGLGGAPLRLGCRPEAAIITLRRG